MLLTNLAYTLSTDAHNMLYFMTNWTSWGFLVVLFPEYRLEITWGKTYMNLLSL